jgi:DNA-binding transcriptional LysR family regulator
MTTSPSPLWSSAIDMNLLPTLDALLRERNVTRAAEKLGISQPSASGALARLRRHFDDELLYRTGNRYQLTPLGAQLLGHTGQALAGVRRVFDSTTDYDAAGSDREFRLVMHDYSAMVIADLLLRQFRDRAPRASVHLEQTVGSIVDGTADRLLSVDGAVLPRGLLPDDGAVDLFEDRWVCIASADSDVEELTKTDVVKSPWVFSHDRATGDTPAARILSAHRIKPDVVAVIVEDLLSVPFLVRGAGGLALVPERLAERVGPRAGIRVVPSPLAPEPLRMALWFHGIYAHDPGHRWLRELLVASTSGLRHPLPQNGSTT